MTTFRASTEAGTGSAAASLAINVPAGVVDDDHLILFGVTADGDDGGFDALSGWTEEVDAAANLTGGAAPSPPGMSIWTRRASSEPSSYTITPTAGATGICAKMIAFSGGDLSAILDAVITTANGDSTNADPPSITTVTDEALTIVACFHDSETITGQTVPSGYTDPNGLGRIVGVGGGNGCTLGIAYRSSVITPAGAENPAAFTTDTEQWAAATVAIRPSTTDPTITDVDGDEDYDDAETGVVITGVNFETPQGTGKVEISDNAVYATGTKVAQIVTAWGATEITVTGVLGSLAPGPLWMWVTNDTGDRNGSGFVITVHRAQAFRMIASANIATSGEDTTQRLVTPAAKVGGDFAAGRIQDDENPADAIDVGLDAFYEDEWCIEAVGTRARAEQYQFRVLVDGVVVDTTSVDPRWTVTLAAGGAIDATPDLAISAAADLKGQGELDASSAMAITAAADLPGRGQLDSSSAMVFSAAADLKGRGVLTAPPALVFSETADLNAIGKLDAAATLVFSAATALLRGLGILGATAAMSFSAAADLALAPNAIDATPDLVISATADLNARGDVDATAALILSATADLQGGVTLVASPSMSISVAADLGAIGVLSVGGGAITIENDSVVLEDGDSYTVIGSGTNRLLIAMGLMIDSNPSAVLSTHQLNATNFDADGTLLSDSDGMGTTFYAIRSHFLDGNAASGQYDLAISTTFDQSGSYIAELSGVDQAAPVSFEELLADEFITTSPTHTISTGVGDLVILVVTATASQTTTKPTDLGGVDAWTVQIQDDSELLGGGYDGSVYTCITSQAHTGQTVTAVLSGEATHCASFICVVKAAPAPPIMQFSIAADLKARGSLDATPDLIFSAIADLVDADGGVINATPDLTISATADLEGLGKLDATSDLVFSIAADLINATSTGPISATPDLVLSTTADLNALGELDATPDLVFSATADLNALGELDATPDLVFSATADLSAIKALDATPDLLFSLLADLNAIGALNSTPDLVFSLLADLNAIGALNSTPDLVFSLVANLINATPGGDISASTSLILSATADLQGTGDLDATPDLVFSVTADLINATPSGPISASPSLVFSAAADLQPIARLNASSSLVFSAAADLKGLGELNASPTLVFSALADLTVAISQITASPLITFSQTADLKAEAILAATADIVFGITANIGSKGVLSSTSSIEFTVVANITDGAAEKVPNTDRTIVVSLLNSENTVVDNQLNSDRIITDNQLNSNRIIVT